MTQLWLALKSPLVQAVLKTMSKNTKRRECPAIGREIASAECGEKRGSAYACPAECPYFPFAPANYDGIPDLEMQVDQKGAHWMFEESRRLGDPISTQERADRIRDGIELEAFMVWNLYLKRSASGLTCVQRWEKAGFPGVKNDERVMLRARSHIRVCLLEVHRILDGESVEGVDLLDADRKPLRIFDRSLASAAPRFGLYMSWLYPLPHFWRISGAAIQMPEFGEIEPEEAVGEFIRHLGGPESDPDRRLWLAEHFKRFEKAVHATALARRAEMFSKIDAHFGRAVYELKAPFEKCARLLDAVQDVEDDPPADDEREEGFCAGRVWFSGKSVSHAEALGGRAVLGRVLMGQTHWRLQAMGKGRLEEIRQRFEERMGKLVHFAGERRDDLAATMAAKDPKFDKSLVPPRMLEGGQMIVLETSRVPAPAPGKTDDFTRELAAANERTFLEGSIPALGGMTPRQAAKDPSQRPRLIRLMKTRIRDRDQQNLRSGRRDDLDWMLRELGLDELMFDPPPPRARFDPGADDDEPADDFETRPEAPRLVGEPFDIKKASERITAGVAHFETASDAMDELDASGSFLIEDAQELTEDTLNEKEFSYLLPFLISAWFAFVPPGVRSPDIDFDDLVDAFNATVNSVEASEIETARGFMDGLLEGSRQPALVTLVVARLMESAGKGPRRDAPRPQCLFVMIALIRAVVDCLDEALRD